MCLIMKKVSIAATLPKAQQDPHRPWSFIGVVYVPFQLAKAVVGRSAAVAPPFAVEVKETELVVVLPGPA